MPGFRLPPPPREPGLRAAATLLALVLHAGAVLLLLAEPERDEPEGWSAFVLVPTEGDVNGVPPPADGEPAGGAAGGAPGGAPAEPDGAPGAGPLVAPTRVPDRIDPAGAAALPGARVAGPAGPAPVELLAPTTPLEAGPEGLRRRVRPRDPRAIAIARAESLVNARMRSLPGAGVPKEPAAIGIANGGVAIAVPWQGFVRKDRADDVWRRERCEGKDDGASDKDGEGEARAGQCS